MLLFSNLRRFTLNYESVKSRYLALNQKFFLHEDLVAALDIAAFFELLLEIFGHLTWSLDLFIGQVVNNFSDLITVANVDFLRFLLAFAEDVENVFLVILSLTLPLVVGRLDGAVATRFRHAAQNISGSGEALGVVWHLEVQIARLGSNRITARSSGVGADFDDASDGVFAIARGIRPWIKRREVQLVVGAVGELDQECPPVPPGASRTADSGHHVIGSAASLGNVLPRVRVRLPGHSNAAARDVAGHGALVSAHIAEGNGGPPFVVVGHVKRIGARVFGIRGQGDRGDGGQHLLVVKTCGAVLGGVKGKVGGFGFVSGPRGSQIDDHVADLIVGGLVIRRSGLKAPFPAARALGQDRRGREGQQEQSRLHYQSLLSWLLLF